MTNDWLLQMLNVCWEIRQNISRQNKTVLNTSVKEQTKRERKPVRYIEISHMLTIKYLLLWFTGHIEQALLLDQCMLRISIRHLSHPPSFILGSPYICFNSSPTCHHHLHPCIILLSCYNLLFKQCTKDQWSFITKAAANIYMALKTSIDQYCANINSLVSSVWKESGKMGWSVNMTLLILHETEHQVIFLFNVCMRSRSLFFFCISLLPY